MSNLLKPAIILAGAWWFWPSISPYISGGPAGDLDFQVLLGNINNEWRHILPSYRKPRLVIYEGTTQAPEECGGQADSRMPFYCPANGAIYLSPDFVRVIPCSGKSCQFGLATVLAHEVGHAVQHQIGLMSEGPRFELQADCLAGLWAKHEDDRLRREGKPPLVEPGDIEAAMRTAGAFGNPSHGSGQQRQASFYRGWTQGTLAACTRGGAA